MQTWAFMYDRGGNILSKSLYAYTTGTLGTPLQTIPYTYDATWKNKLASYDGGPITYDTWDKSLTKTGALAATFGTLNPFRFPLFYF